MFLFYTPTKSGDSLLLEGDEMRHAIKTLRMRTGDEIYSTDGLGYKYKCRISGIGKSEVALELLNKESCSNTRKSKLHIAIALTKKSNRFEWFLEKATEIGIHKITPLITARTEKKSFNYARSQKIIISAMKQSLRCYLPVLEDIRTIEEFVNSISQTDSQKLIAHYKPENAQLGQILKEGKDVVTMIGPEGDFIETESQLVEGLGFHSINLGNFRLRTETAGVVACHTFNLVNYG